MDRRGFGGSGDAPDYAIERDFEDVAAVVDEVAASTGGPVALWGHSYGAGCAMGGAALTGNVSHLILYEPGLGLSYASNTIEAIESALAAGDRETAIVTVLADLLELTEEEIDAFRASPLWPLRLAVAATIPRECRVEDSWVYRPGAFESITAPILMLAGSESPPSLKECTRLALDALPAATQLQVLDGHAHLAHKADPDLVAGIIREFVSS
jgi:pimeloyl-ACP methyl ester carboxylesterase